MQTPCQEKNARPDNHLGITLGQEFKLGMNFVKNIDTINCTALFASAPVSQFSCPAAFF